MERGRPEISVLDGDARRERTRGVEVLARAFRDNPLNLVAVRGGPARRLRSNASGMRVMLGSITAGSGSLVLAARCPGAEAPGGLLIAASPFGFPLPPPPLASQLRCLWGQGWRTMRRWGQVYRALERIHPLEPHWYLSVLGVDPPSQRGGLGSALLEAFLGRVDRDAAPAYLETDRTENLPFYQRVGFEVVKEPRVMDVPVFCMWRAAN
jgi:ribosomal protein S18 acetylase RimI-like enzyme